MTKKQNPVVKRTRKPAPTDAEPLSEMERHALFAAALGWPRHDDPAPTYASEVRP